MSNAAYFAEKARCCRDLAERARAPEVAEQLRLWAEEFGAIADALEAGEPVPDLRRRHPAAG